MKGKKIVKLDNVIKDSDLQKQIVEQEITSDFVLELYEKSKKLRGKKKKEMLTTAELLSKHIGKWLVK
jgi:hypothetical protein